MKELVYIHNNKALTSSRKIAEKFGKRHDNILRAIESIECSEEFNALNFEEVNYVDSKGEERPEYIITRDGFAFLVMGFTGKEAAKFKEEYINAFNEMEVKLKALSEPKTKEELWLEAMTSLLDEVEQQKVELEQAKKTIEIQAPKVKYVNEVLVAENCHTVNTIAKELGTSAKSLNQELYNKKVQYKSDNHWVLYAKYQDKGYTKTRTHIYYDSENRQRTSIQTVWTEKGRSFIHSLFFEDRNMIITPSGIQVKNIKK